MKRNLSIALVLILQTACAHQGVTKSTTSTNAPARLTTVTSRAPAEFNSGVEALKLPPAPSKIVNDEAQTRDDERLDVASLKPAPIEIPKAKALASLENEKPFSTPMVFDIPVAYNARVKYWIQFFQTSGRGWFTKWMERSTRYLPQIKKDLKRHGMPQDLAYIAMIESGLSSQANSVAKAVGPWQFIRETGKRYGLKVSWWIDERRDFHKSTDAAARYLKYMHRMFNSWHLAAAGYNTGENRIKRLVERRKTKNFWKLAQHDDLELETRDYVPKLMAAILIAKAPQMYGFNQIKYQEPLSFEHFRVPGGTQLDELALAIGYTSKHLRELNPELVQGLVPNHIEGHLIRIPKGTHLLVSRYVRKTFVTQR